MSGRGRGRRRGPSRRALDVPMKRRNLSASEFEQINGIANEESLVASFTPTRPIELLQQRFRLMLVTREEFTTNATAGDTETFNLTQGIVDAPGVSFLLYENGSQVEADAIDYAADSFDYTDDGTGNSLDAYYLPETRSMLTVRKEAPQSKGQFSLELYEGSTTLTYQVDQVEDPVRFDFDRRLEGAVPTDWQLNVYADGPWSVAWDESTRGTSATNAVLQFPIQQAQSQIPNLQGAVIEDMAGWG